MLLFKNDNLISKLNKTVMMSIISKNDFLKSMAQKYIWWQDPTDVLRVPQKIIAQIMNIGTFDDLELLTHFTNKQELIDILHNAKIGQFNPKSWHYRLDLASLGNVPPLPNKRF